MFLKDWKCYQLKELAQIVRGSSPRPAGSPEYFNGSFLPWITVADVTSTSRMYLERTKTALTEEGAKYTRILEPETLILTNSGATLGTPKIIKLKAGANDGIAAFLAIRRKCSKEFLYYFLQSKTLFFRERLAPGVGQPNLNTELIGNVDILCPPLSEQKKIVDVLLTWDKAIEKTELLISFNKKRRHALMHSLLKGKQRFSEFKNVGWRSFRIGDVARHVSTKNNKNYELPVLSCTKHRGLVDSLSYFGKRMFSEDLSTYKIVERWQFAYATNHIEEGSIGYQNLYDKALISPMYTVFATNKEVNDNFLFKLFKTETYRHIFEAMTSGSINRRGSLRWDHFARIKIELPSYEEQKRIASVLQKCDQGIELLEMRRDALKAQKRGLMQKLLTGKIRVKV